MKGEAMETSDVNEEARVGVVGVIRGHQHRLSVAHQSHERFLSANGDVPNIEAVPKEPGGEQVKNRAEPAGIPRRPELIRFLRAQEVHRATIERAAWCHRPH
jgi:hypothetical protein